MPDAATPPPDRGALSGLVAGISSSAASAEQMPSPRTPGPGAAPSQLRQYFTQNAGPTRLNAVG